MFSKEKKQVVDGQICGRFVETVAKVGPVGREGGPILENLHGMEIVVDNDILMTFMIYNGKHLSSIFIKFYKPSVVSLILAAFL